MCIGLPAAVQIGLLIFVKKFPAYSQSHYRNLKPIEARVQICKLNKGGTQGFQIQSRPMSDIEQEEDEEAAEWEAQHAAYRAQEEEDELALRLKIAEDRIDQLEKEKNRKAEETTKLFKDMHEMILSETVAREIIEERKQKEIKLAESGITLDINMERHGRKESELRILKELNERCVSLSVEMGAHAIGVNQAASSADQVSEQTQILTALDAEFDRRRGAEAEFIDKLMLETKSLHEMISTERKLREESTRTMVLMIEKFQERLSSEIQQEAKAREKSTQTILQILEETSSRLDAKRKPH